MMKSGFQLSGSVEFVGAAVCHEIMSTEPSSWGVREDDGCGWPRNGSLFYSRILSRVDFHFFSFSLYIKVQLQEAERRWEEVQSYIRKRTAEHEAAQQGKGEAWVRTGSLPLFCL